MQLEFRDEHTVQLGQGPGKDPLLWSFDRVFHGDTPQADIFNLAARETVEDVLKGYNGTIFAYGQVQTPCKFCAKPIRFQPLALVLTPAYYCCVLNNRQVLARVIR